MEAHATPYPVLFANGEEERDLGYVGVSSVTSHRSLMQSLATKCGMNSSEINCTFVCRKANDESKKQRMSVTSNFNFGIILNQHPPTKERDAHFLVMPKRSKRERKTANSRSKKASTSSTTVSSGHDASNASAAGTAAGNTSEGSSDNEDNMDDASSIGSGGGSGAAASSSSATGAQNARSAPTSAAQPQPSSTSATPAAKQMNERARLERERLYASNGSRVRPNTSSSPGAPAGAASSTDLGSNSSAVPVGFPKPSASLRNPAQQQVGTSSNPSPFPTATQHQQQQQQPSNPVASVAPTVPPPTAAATGAAGAAYADGFQRLQIGPEPGRPCKVCNFCRENNTEVFHCCPNDKVVFGFRGGSPWGAPGSAVPGSAPTPPR